MSKLSIIGKGDGWELAPYDVESWGVNDLILRRPVDKVFSIHPYSTIKEVAERAKAAERAKELGIPCIDCSNYPIDEVVRFFKSDYFANSICYMLALAIFKEYEELNLYGVNMVTRRELIRERPCVEFWCGQAAARGASVNIYGKESAVMRTWNRKMYGYDRQCQRPT